MTESESRTPTVLYTARLVDGDPLLLRSTEKEQGWEITKPDGVRKLVDQTKNYTAKLEWEPKVGQKVVFLSGQEALVYEVVEPRTPAYRDQFPNSFYVKPCVDRPGFKRYNTPRS